MDHDPTDIRQQERTQEARAKKAKDKATLEGEDWKWLMAQARGRRLVWRLLTRTGLYRSSFTGNSETFFREGERNVGLGLVALMGEACPEDFARMMSESRGYK